MGEPVVDLLEQAWREIDEVCADLAEDQWKLSTDLPGWTVQDNVAHVVGTERSLLGEPAPEAEGDPPAHVRNPVGEVNERWVAARRHLPGREVLDEFREVTGRRLAALRERSDEAWEERVSSPAGQVPYREFMTVRVMDAWVHQQDVRRAVGRPGGLEGPVAETAVDRLAGGVPFVVGKAAGAPEGSTVVVELTGPVERTLAIGVRDGRARPLDEVPAEPTVRIALGSEAFAALTCGRWRSTDVLGTGAARIDGDADLGRRILEHMGFMI